jgi:hypothetical protein
MNDIFSNRGENLEDKVNKLEACNQEIASSRKSGRLLSGVNIAINKYRASSLLNGINKEVSLNLGSKDVKFLNKDLKKIAGIKQKIAKASSNIFSGQNNKNASSIEKSLESILVEGKNKDVLYQLNQRLEELDTSIEENDFVRVVFLKKDIADITNTISESQPQYESLASNLLKKYDFSHKVTRLSSVVASTEVKESMVQTMKLAGAQYKEIVLGHVPESRFNRDLLLIDKYKEIVPANITEYGFDQDQRFEIAKVLADQSEEKISENIDKFDLSEPQCFEIAKLISGRLQEQFSDNVDKYQLSPDHNIEIANIAVKKYRNSISKNIDRYGFDISQRFEMAKLVAAKSHEEISKNIDKYDLNLSQRFEIAKLAASQIDNGVSINIDKYQLKPEMLLEIAIIAASHKGENISVVIGNYDFDQTQRFEIAKLAVVQGDEIISKYIMNYDLDNNQCLEIAKMSASNPSGMFPIEGSFKNYRLSPEQNFEVAKISATYEGKAISAFIKDFNFDRPQRFEIAKIAISHMNEGVSGYIEDYDLNLEQRLELLEIAIRRPVEKVSASIESYQLEPEKQFEVAKIAARQIGNNVSGYIDNYDLTQDQRFEIAKIVAESEEGGISFFMDDYQLTEEQDIEVLKIAANNCGSDVASSVGRSYSISNQIIEVEKDKQILEILKIAILNDFEGVSEIINYLNISKEFLEELSLHVLVNDPYKNYDFNSFPLNALDLEDPALACIARPIEVWEESVKGSEGHKDFIFPDLAPMLQKKDPEKVYHPMKFLGSLALLCKKNKISQKEFLELKPFIGSILEFRDTKLKTTLLMNLLERNKEGNLGKAKEVIGLLGGGKKNSKGITELSSLFLVDYLSKPEFKEILPQLSALIQNKKVQKESTSYTVIIQCLDTLLKKESLTTEEKINYLSLLCTDPKEKVTAKEFVERATLLTCVLEQDWIGDSGIQELGLKAFVESKFIECTGLSNPVENFTEKFSRTFAKSRSPLAIYIYASKIKSQSEDVKKSLEKAVVAILEGNLSEVRMDMSENKHLQTVFEGREELLEEWSKGKEAPLIQEDESSSEKFTIHDTDNWEDLLLCGTEVVESCQNVNSHPDTNKCLLACLLDGKNRIIVIKNSKGKIVARRIIRVLWDEKNKRPVLFQEKFFHNPNVNKSMIKSLDDMVVQKAKDLGLPLFEKGEVEGTDSLSSLQSSAPFEYFDSVVGSTTGVLLAGVRRGDETVEITANLVKSSENHS